MPEFPKTTTYSSANTAPTRTVAELKTWWARDAWAGFTVIKVKVPEGGIKDGLLTFMLADEAEKRSPRTFTVELHDDAVVWGDLPSTAQFATPDRPFGFLLVSRAWAEKEGVDLGIYGGGKWPIAAWDAHIVGLRRAIKDDTVRARLIGTAKDDALRTKLLEGLDALEQLASRHLDSGG